MSDDITFCDGLGCGNNEANCLCYLKQQLKEANALLDECELFMAQTSSHPLGW